MCLCIRQQTKKNEHFLLLVPCYERDLIFTPTSFPGPLPRDVVSLAFSSGLGCLVLYPGLVRFSLFVI
jgi:hypothetical protein